MFFNLKWWIDRLIDRSRDRYIERRERGRETDTHTQRERERERERV